MPKGKPHLMVGYGQRTGVVTRPGLPIHKPGTSGSALVNKIRKGR